VQCLTADWTAGVRSPTEAEDFPSNLCVQTGCGAHPASCTMGTGGSFPGGKGGRGVMLTAHPLLVSLRVLNTCTCVRLRIAVSVLGCTPVWNRIDTWSETWAVYLGGVESSTAPPPRCRVSLLTTIFLCRDIGNPTQRNPNFASSALRFETNL
jgi:hypothetical protein